MVTFLVAALIVFIFTTVLTIAGVGAAFILIPAFYWLGIPLREASDGSGVAAQFNQHDFRVADLRQT